MGVSLVNKKRDLSMDYMSFGLLRQCIAYSYNHEMGLLYKKWHDSFITGGLTNDELKRYNEICNDDLQILLVHSDCDGKLTGEECKKIYNVIKDVKFEPYPTFEDKERCKKLEELFEKLKEILKDNLIINFY